MYKKNVYGKSRKGTHKKSSKKRNNTAIKKPSAPIINPFRPFVPAGATLGTPCGLPSTTANPSLPAPTSGKEDSYSTDVNTSGTRSSKGTLLAIDPDCPYKKSIDTNSPGERMCSFLEAIGKIMGQHKVADDEAEVIFDLTLPAGPIGEENMQVFRSLQPEMRLRLLDLWDSCFAAMHSGAPEKEFQKRMCLFKYTLLEFLDVLKANRASGDTSDGPTEQDLAAAYEKDQYLKRKALGEPVLFQDGRLCFERIIFEHGFQPGPFPGMDLYQRNGKCVDAATFSKWLHDMEPQREARKNEAVGFLGCPICPVRAEHMVWLFSTTYNVCGSESYRAFIKRNGIPLMSLSFFGSLARMNRPQQG